MGEGIGPHCGGTDVIDEGDHDAEPDEFEATLEIANWVAAEQRINRTRRVIFLVEFSMGYL
ncbi:MAG: hypothetical protein ACREDR_18450 [Blastocatellia bacterium]